MSFDNSPIYGCETCKGTGGRLGCLVHGWNNRAKVEYKPICIKCGLKCNPISEYPNMFRCPTCALVHYGDNPT